MAQIMEKSMAREKQTDRSLLRFQSVVHLLDVF